MVTVVKTHGAPPEAPWKPLAPHMASACARAWGVLCALLALCPPPHRPHGRRGQGRAWGLREKQKRGIVPRPGCGRLSCPRRCLDRSIFNCCDVLPGG